MKLNGTLVISSALCRSHFQSFDEYKHFLSKFEVDSVRMISHHYVCCTSDWIGGKFIINFKCICKWEAKEHQIC